MKCKHGFTLIELMMVVTIIALIAAIAIPNLFRSRMTANEASATSSMRTIGTGEVAYQASGIDVTTNGIGKYGTLTSLGTGANPFIDRGLSSGIKGGYEFQVTPTMEGNSVPRYTATSSPVVQDKTGFKTFFLDESGLIRFETDGSTATSTSPPL